MKTKTLHEIHTDGMDALLKTLGPVDMIRFLTMFDEGHGDYTKERHEWLPDNLGDIKGSLLERQKKRKTKKQI